MKPSHSEASSDPAVKLKRWFQTVIRSRWKEIITAAVIFLAALTTVSVNIQTITGWFNDDPRPVEAGGKDRTNPGPIARDPNQDSDEDTAPQRPQHAILIGYSRAKMRARNDVRRMLDTEDAQVLSLLTSVYGFARHRSLRLRLPSWGGTKNLELSTLSLRRERSNMYQIELHAFEGAGAMILVNVSRGDAARLSNPTGNVGEVFGYFSDDDEARSVMVGIPISRIRRWQYRTQDFAAIDVN